MNAKTLDIRDVADTAGLPPSTLRYYEKLGLIRSSGKHGLRRQYDPDVLERLSFIALAQAAQFSLKDVSAMMPTPSVIKINRDTFVQKADEVESQIQELTELVSLLRHIADCPHENQFDCPTFRSLLRSSRRPRRG
ncbi:MAG: helix-turn-helix domain-containing protein [Shimia sp.]|nr:helix-turn-helix domain-containing protein [Shimia sp.]MCP4825974.1 helix-turn-helix domain-containing protein [Shimia sp.]